MANPIVEINLDRLLQNARLIRERAGDAELLVVVKADGYGHGAVPISRALEAAGIRYLGVFTIKEALELRNNGINTNVIIFERLSKQTIPLAAEHSITVNLSWFGDLDLIKLALADGVKIPAFHLKLDTGMSRLGIPYLEASSFFEKLQSETGIVPEGVYTHLSTSDEGDLSFAYEQKNRFEEALSEIQNFCSPKWIHVANSGGLVNMPDSFYNMVRVGLLIYGATPSSDMLDPIPIEPVMNFKGEIVLVRRVNAGTPVSYGALYKPERDSYLGVVQAGFADGVPRPWFERGVVAWKGKRYRIAGRICMDQFMVDFKDQQPKEGDRVLIWGKDKENHIPIEEISKDIDLTPYALLTSVNGKRIERKFLNE